MPCHLRICVKMICKITITCKDLQKKSSRSFRSIVLPPAFDFFSRWQNDRPFMYVCNFIIFGQTLDENVPKTTVLFQIPMKGMAKKRFI